MSKQVKIWIEAMRLRTLPVSLSGVIMAIGIAVWQNHFRWIPAILCIIFALLAQVVSNFANEYYDYLRGADKKGRVGPRRGVTEGDIKPKTLRSVTFITLAVACLVGCGLIPYGGWQMIPVGILIAVFALAYSAGPYPLSYHGLGELTVFLFYGIVPVIFSYYVIAGRWDALAVLGGITIGFMGVNVLLVNNYRDVEDDIEAGKRTAVVIFGRKLAAAAYLFNGFMAIAMLSPLWLMIYLNGTLSQWTYIVPLLYLVMHTITWIKLNRRRGAALNPLLGETARNMLIFTILMLLAFIL
jgi:1,4-dihydroxy-2-naphthoate octaprenyltransferase